MNRPVGTVTLFLLVLVSTFAPTYLFTCLAFAMAPTSPSAPPTRLSAASIDESDQKDENKCSNNKWLILDFDGTCTCDDTTPLLPRMASLHAGDDEAKRKERLGRFNALEQEYFDAYTAVKGRIFKDDNNDGVETDTDVMDLHEALDSLDEVSTLVTSKVSESACLAGLPSHPSHIAELIEKHEELQHMTRLQAGCVAACAQAHLSGWGLGVLSINWCPNLIEAALMMPVRRHLGKEDDTHPRAKVWSNEIDEDGVVKLHIPGASAKRLRIQALKDKLRKEEPGSESSSPIVMYIGDSSTDLSGLMEADIGIMLGTSNTMLSFAKRWDIKLSKLSNRRGEDCKDHNGLHERDADTIWMADGWEEINNLLTDI